MRRRTPPDDRAEHKGGRRWPGPFATGWLDCWPAAACSTMLIGDWSLPFVVIAGVLLIAALVLYFLVVPEPIERPERVAELAEQGAQG